MEIRINNGKKVDYNRLRDFLAAEQWKVADEETYQIMLQVVNREAETHLELQDVEEFPCTDLVIIDQLWVEYSHGKFGFSVQQEIYQYLNCPYWYDRTAEKAFAHHVGWRRKGEWVGYNDLTFDLTAPKGHLPSKLWVEDPFEWYGDTIIDGSAYLFERIKVCLSKWK